MFLDDLHLVTEQVNKYGLQKPFVDLGGLGRPCLADYEITMRTGVQTDRYLTLPNNAHVFDEVAGQNYLILNPENGDPPIEALPAYYRDYFGMAVCLNVIEHVVNPFAVFDALYAIMKQDSLLIISTVFSFPYHPSPRDYWRFSPDCLQMLAEYANFTILECDWRLTITADKGIREIHNGEPQEIRSVYTTLRKL